MLPLEKRFRMNHLCIQIFQRVLSFLYSTSKPFSSNHMLMIPLSTTYASRVDSLKGNSIGESRMSKQFQVALAVSLLIFSSCEREETWKEIPVDTFALKRVSVDMKEAPVERLVTEMSKQAGYEVQWAGHRDASVSFSVNDTPLLEAAAKLAKENGYSLDILQSSSGTSLQLAPSETDQVKGYGIGGPILLLWSGLSARPNYELDDPNSSLPVSKYRMHYLTDPRSGAEVGDGQPVRDIPVTFLGTAGKEVSLKSDHKKGVFVSGQTWEFEPGSELTGDKTTVRITIPYMVPKKGITARVPWKEDTRTIASVAVTLSNLQSENSRWQKPGSFDSVEGNIWRAKVNIKREPLDQGSPESAMLKLQTVAFVGKDGKYDGAVDVADGLNGPREGYTFDIAARVPSRSFKPDAIDLVWAAEYERRTATIVIPEAPLR